MKRREFLGLIVGSAVSFRSARSQQVASVRRIGILSSFSAANTQRWEKALLLGLRDAGWVDGRNLFIERRYAEGKMERLPELAGDLLRQKVEVIVTTVTADTTAAKTATSDIPIVMAAVGDPVATSLVEKFRASRRQRDRSVANDTRFDRQAAGALERARARCVRYCVALQSGRSALGAGLDGSPALGPNAGHQVSFNADQQDKRSR